MGYIPEDTDYEYDDDWESSQWDCFPDNGPYDEPDDD